MNSSFILFSIFISVICVLFAVFQYYFNYQKLTAVKLYNPVFNDLIPTDLHFYPFSLNKDRAKILNLIENFKKSNLPGRSIFTTELEVENCLKAALAYKLSGKPEKALKLFEHAAAIAPENPDVLNQYGEYLEQIQKDVISADELYFKVLILKSLCFLQRLLL